MRCPCTNSCSFFNNHLLLFLSFHLIYISISGSKEVLSLPRVVTIASSMRSHEGMQRGSLGFVRSVLEKLQSHLLLPWVGHFVVVATGRWSPRRFVVGLNCLNDPEFLNLLEQVEEEFGLSQEGALAIPCRPDELLRIMGIRMRGR